MKVGMTDESTDTIEQAHLTGAPAGEMNNIGGTKEVAMKI